MFSKLKKIIKKPKNISEVIEEIHHTFYTEVDRLLSEAKISNSLHTDKQELINKCNRLKQLGFSSAQEVQEGEKEIERLDQLQKINENKADLIEAINYFSTKYPMYKFITENSVKNICQKYNLIYASVGRYTGTIPNENLKHIENFRIQKEDKLYIEKCNYLFSAREDYVSYENSICSECSDFLGSYYSYFEAPLEIVAPLKDFNTEGMELKDFKLSKVEIPDPIVLQPVFYKRNKYYLIVTAWGIEAKDGEVLNPIYD